MMVTFMLLFHFLYFLNVGKRVEFVERATGVPTLLGPSECNVVLTLLAQPWRGKKSLLKKYFIFS